MELKEGEDAVIVDRSHLEHQTALPDSDHAVYAAPDSNVASSSASDLAATKAPANATAEANDTNAIHRSFILGLRPRKQ